MFEKLKSLFSQPDRTDGHAIALPLAVAALLVEAARADENYTEIEKAMIEAALSRQFALDEDGARALRSEAERVQQEALDIHRFTKVAKTMSNDDKLALVERLWTIILSDGERDPHEDTLVRRVCGLIYVSDPESGAARRRAQKALQSSPTG